MYVNKKLYVLQRPPPDVAPKGGKGSRMNKFEQVSSDYHHMSLEGRQSRGAAQ